MQSIVILEAILQLCMFSMIGLYFIFSNTIISALEQTDSGAESMAKINLVILNPAFYLLFFGSALASLYWLFAKDGLQQLAGAVFFVGTFVVTLAGNIPLNNRLKDAVEGSTDDAGKHATWLEYQRYWLAWNHVRTLSSMVAGLLLLL